MGPIMLENLHHFETRQQICNFGIAGRSHAILPKRNRSMAAGKAAVKSQDRTQHLNRARSHERNPRLLRNVKWNGIKSANKASVALTNALALNQRPSVLQYTGHQGSSTCLLALHHLQNRCHGLRGCDQRITG